MRRIHCQSRRLLTAPGLVQLAAEGLDLIHVEVAASLEIPIGPQDAALDAEQPLELLLSHHSLVVDVFPVDQQRHRSIVEGEGLPAAGKMQDPALFRDRLGAQVDVHSLADVGLSGRGVELLDLVRRNDALVIGLRWCENDQCGQCQRRNESEVGHEPLHS